jgi:hypothetical protein
MKYGSSHVCLRPTAGNDTGSFEIEERVVLWI